MFFGVDNLKDFIRIMRISGLHQEAYFQRLGHGADALKQSLSTEMMVPVLPYCVTKSSLVRPFSGMNICCGQRGDLHRFWHRRQSGLTV